MIDGHGYWAVVSLVVKQLTLYGLTLRKLLEVKKKKFYFDPSLKEVAINRVAEEEGGHDIDPVNTVNILK